MASIIWKRFRKHPGAIIGIFVFLLLMVLVTIVPLSPYDPEASSITERLQPPSLAHLMGTDALGRDMLSRVIDGARISLPMGLLATVAMFVLGTLVGALAGYVGGTAEEIMMRIADVFLAFPAIVLAMAIAAALGPSLRNGLLAIVVVLWPKYARLVRSLVLTVK